MAKGKNKTHKRQTYSEVTTSMLYHRLLRPLLFSMEPEIAHSLAIRYLKSNILSARRNESSALSTQVSGIDFPNVLGMAAGFDKNAECIKGLSRLGFGFIEVGTITPQPQAGNPQPRMFRLVEDEALLNRLGFNNQGAEAIVKRLHNRPRQVIVGANIGKNKATEDALSDYALLIQKCYTHADYITVNISSPNTPGLRDLQEANQLRTLLNGLKKICAQCQQDNGKRTPLWVKIAPDLDDKALYQTLEVLMEAEIDAIIISNTTIRREVLSAANHKHYAQESGGISGRPLLDVSTDILFKSYQFCEGGVPLIGVGGIASAEDAMLKITSGASLLQLYTGLIYHGPALIRRILTGLERMVEREGCKNISELVGTRKS